MILNLQFRPPGSQFYGTYIMVPHLSNSMLLMRKHYHNDTLKCILYLGQDMRVEMQSKKLDFLNTPYDSFYRNCFPEVLQLLINES